EFSAKRLKKDLQIDYLIEGKNDVQTVTNHLYSPSANIAGFGAGYLVQGAKTIIPKEAFVKMDFRLVANMKADSILGKIQRHLKTKDFGDIELTVHSKEDPAKTAVESHIAQVLIKSAEMVYGISPNVWPTIAGTGPL
ncbi:MAG: peptidase dimerization domain-containing protein, partial [Thaumarchaeota archaeon]|nr:peptidase dimerization domain-containing protein [Nitrososphaerota archaeon]